MTTDIQKIVDDWINYFEIAEDNPQRDNYWGAVATIMDWNSEEPERVWEFIILAYKRQLSSKAISNLAAGPLEDLLSNHGADYIDRVVELASRDKQFNYLLGGIWQNEIPDEVWKQIQAVREKTW